MLFHIQHQLIQHGTSTNKSEHDFAAIGSLSTRFDSLHNLNQILKIIVQTNVAGIHDDKLAIQTVLLFECQNLLVVLIQRIDFVLVDPVVDHDGLRNFLSLETVLHRFHQVATDCDHKVATLTAELVEPHHGIGHQLALGVANSQHLLRVKVLNVVNVLGVFHPFAPDAQQTGRCQVLDNIFHK